LQAQGFSVGGLNYAAIGTYMTVTGFTNGVVIPNLVIPDKVLYYGANILVRAIGVNAFNGCGGLASVTLQSATPPTLGADAFNGVSDNCTFNCPESSRSNYTADPSWAPYFSSLTSGEPTYPFTFTVSTDANGATTATVTGLADTTITALVIPDKVTDGDGVIHPVTAIGDNAFANCTALTAVKLLPATPPTLLTFLKSSPNLKSSPGNAFEAIPAICTFTCPDYALPLYQANPDWVPYFGAAPTATDEDDDEKTSIRPLIGSSGESIVSLYTFRGQLLRKAAVTLPATPSVLRTVLSVPSSLYILATPSSTHKIHL
jgi:hypothetical protein